MSDRTAETADLAFASDLAALLASARVIVTAGTGGVGKTTLASAIGLAQAQLGRRCVVVTIDPARRLAETLGLSALDNTPRLVSISVQEQQSAASVAGELWACMLDTKATFDDVIHAYARPEQAEAILANRLYTNISGALSGTQEYMAAEKVHQLVADGRFDVVVVDTPPAANALDFVTAPRRLVRFLDHSLFRVLIAPGKGALRFVSSAAQAVLKPLTQVVGGAVVSDAIEFFRLFDGLEAGFREHASNALEILTDPATAWILVTTSDPEPIRAAVDFAGQIGQTGIRVDGVIVNRAEPRYPNLPTQLPGRSSQVAAVNEILADHRARLQRDRAGIETLRQALPAPIVSLIDRFDPRLDEAAALFAVAAVLAPNGATPRPSDASLS